MTRAEARWERVRQIAGIPEEKWALYSRAERRAIERELIRRVRRPGR